ncbi:MAG: dTDP-4-dehydrorhamnose 3,5-epimerase [Bacteroides sp.]|nr:dTDP-4-dehydrorhamnose 3,5-epimerase [Bacteroides sp.]
MKLIETTLDGVVILEPRVFKDDQNFFFESFSQKEFEEKVCKTVFVQENELRAGYGMISGLHFQKIPFCQSRLVRVLEGIIQYVAVDLRKGSLNFGEYISVELTAENYRQIFVPRGFAYGFAILSEQAVLQYKSDNPYAPAYEGALAWNDPSIDIKWQIPAEKTILSYKDSDSPTLNQLNWYFSHREILY